MLVKMLCLLGVINGWNSFGLLSCLQMHVRIGPSLARCLSPRVCGRMEWNDQGDVRLLAITRASPLELRQLSVRGFGRV